MHPTSETAGDASAPGMRISAVCAALRDRGEPSRYVVRRMQDAALQQEAHANLPMLPVGAAQTLSASMNEVLTREVER
jgi:hypothetical protein